MKTCPGIMNQYDGLLSLDICGQQVRPVRIHFTLPQMIISVLGISFAVTRITPNHML